MKQMKSLLPYKLFLFLPLLAVCFLLCGIHARAESLPYEDIDPNSASTYNVSIETIDGEPYFSIITYDLKRVSNIFYRTEGFTLSRGALNTKALRNGAATEYIAMPVYKDESDSYDVKLANNMKYRKNIWRYPLSDIISIVRSNGYLDWAEELQTYYYHNGTDTVYMRFDGIMVTVVRKADGTETQSGYVTIRNGKMESFGVIYTNLPADNGAKITALKNAYGWRDKSKIEYHYNRWIPDEGSVGGSGEGENVIEDFDTPTPVALYETKNYAANFDISMGIPSGEQVTNVISAAAFTGNNLDIRTSTANTSVNAYNITYTVKMSYPDKEWVAEQKTLIGTVKDGENLSKEIRNGLVYYYSVSPGTGNKTYLGFRKTTEREVAVGKTYYKVTKEAHWEDVTRTTSPIYVSGTLGANVSYQYLGSAPQIFEFESMDVLNGHFPENTEGKRLLRYTDREVYYPSLKVNMHVYNTAASTKGLYYTEINQHMSANPATFNYTPAGKNYHYYLPSPSEINRRREITITGKDANDWSGLVAAIQKETEAVAAEISSKSWSRNDYIIINDGKTDYNIMNDTKVTGSDVEGSFYVSAKGVSGTVRVDTNATTAATSSYQYNTGLSFTNINNSLMASRVKGRRTVTIPGNADNVDYPTGASVTYRNIFTKETAFTWTAGKNFFVGADSIYNHVMSDGILSKHDGGDPADGYPIRVHTPIVSPFTIVDSEGNNAKEHTQLVAEKYNQNASNQLLLDTSYYIKWDNQLWTSSLWGETPEGYEDILDDYVTAKYMRFPFDVIYNGTIYTTNTDGKTAWIQVEEPYLDTWSDGADTSKYESNNHWQMTPFSIPSFAKEGGVPGDDIYVEVKVEARNVQGRDLGNHDSCVQVDLNADKSSYVATSRRQVQLSGWLYDFTIVGTENGMVYNGKNFGVYPNPNTSGYDPLALCPIYKEVKSNAQNRLGNRVYRHLTDGTITFELPSTISQLPLKDGSSMSFSSMGAVWRGQDFAFEVKTIADLDDPDDSVEIIPSFTFITPDGEVLSSEKNEILLIKTLPGGGFDRDCVYDPDNFRMDLGENLVKSAYLEDPLFEESYYTREDSNYYQYGDWVKTSLENEHEDLNTTEYDEQAYRYRETDCYTLSHISIPASLRLLSGEYEQLAMNQYNQYVRGGTNTLLTYKGLGNANSRIFTVNGVPGRTLDEAVKYSMQQWHGKYVVSSRVKIIDMREIGTTLDDFYQYMDEHPLFYWDTDEHVYEDEGTLIINFDIYAYKDGEPYLRYNGGNVDAVNMWEKEGYEESTDPALPIRDGDVVVVDFSRDVQDYYEPGILFIN